MKSLDEVTKIKQGVELDLLKQPGVTGIDVGQRTVDGKQTAEFAIRIYVANLREAPAAISNLKDVQGVPVELIERRFEAH